ncbi:galactokinase [Pedobacter paludis]|uniref:Uncharacterized protein n=1 Tax=Pedobacter paludis TaxID=2203212 RepID=A0A317F720_9SPHI|nr:hypothetical protein [Pedobacter paludis]PWS33318.1 hypothetical protein DF947_01445 [Pedobacter paludis]
MNNLKRIFYQLFEQNPYILQIPGWSLLSPEGLVHVLGSEPEDKIYLAISARTDSQFQFYNDAYQSHYSAMVNEKREKGRWYSPMEETAQQFLKNGYPVQGFNLYLSACGQRKHGKTYELLMRTAMAKALSEIYNLELKKHQLISLICRTNNGSVLDGLFLNQMYHHTRPIDSLEATSIHNR